MNGKMVTKGKNIELVNDLEQVREKWESIKKDIGKELDLSEHAFTCWIAPLKLVSCENGRVLINVPWNEENYLTKKISSCFKAYINRLASQDVKVYFMLGKTDNSARCRVDGTMDSAMQSNLCIEELEKAKKAINEVIDCQIRILESSSRTGKKRENSVTPYRILNEVTETYNLIGKDITSNPNNPEFEEPIRVAIYLFRKLTKLSSDDIAMCLNKEEKDIIPACSEIEREVRNNTNLGIRVNNLCLEILKRSMC